MNRFIQCCTRLAFGMNAPVAGSRASDGSVMTVVFPSVVVVTVGFFFFFPAVFLGLVTSETVFFARFFGFARLIVNTSPGLSVTVLGRAVVVVVAVFFFFVDIHTVSRCFF